MTRQTRQNGRLLAVVLVLVLLAAAPAWGTTTGLEFCTGDVGGCWYECRNSTPPPGLGVPEFGDPAPTPEEDKKDGDDGGMVELSAGDSSASPAPYNGMCSDGPACLTP